MADPARLSIGIRADHASPAARAARTTVVRQRAWPLEASITTSPYDCTPSRRSAMGSTPTHPPSGDGASFQTWQSLVQCRASASVKAALVTVDSDAAGREVPEPGTVEPAASQASASATSAGRNGDNPPSIPTAGTCRQADAPLELQAVWPSLPSIKDGDDLKAFTSQPVRNHVGCAWNHELAGAGDSSRAAKIRQPGQTFDSRQERYGNTGRCVGVVACDVSAKVSKVTDRARRPDDGHARGAFRSRFRPHERSQADASL